METESSKSVDMKHKTLYHSFVRKGKETRDRWIYIIKMEDGNTLEIDFTDKDDSFEVSYEIDTLRRSYSPESHIKEAGNEHCIKILKHIFETRDLDIQDGLFDNLPN